jgi:hypothetical protein
MSLVCIYALVVGAIFSIIDGTNYSQSGSGV